MNGCVEVYCPDGSLLSAVKSGKHCTHKSLALKKNFFLMKKQHKHTVTLVEYYANISRSCVCDVQI